MLRRESVPMKKWVFHKRIMVLLICLSMTVSLALPASASETAAEQSETAAEITSCPKEGEEAQDGAAEESSAAENALENQKAVSTETETENRETASQEEKENAEVTDEEAQNMFKQLRWQLVKDHLAQELGIQVEKEDIDTAAFVFAQQQLSQYGIYNAPEDLVRQQAERFMQDERARDMIHEHAIDNKFYAAVREAVKVNEKSISVEDFRKLFEKDEK